MINKINKKLEEANASLHMWQHEPLNKKLEELDSTNWADFANILARAEGKVHAWAMLQKVYINITDRGDEFTKEDVMSVGVELLQPGADDRWSGRGNDVRRARFDGVRSAVDEFRWL